MAVDFIMNYFLILVLLFGTLPNFAISIRAHELSFVQTVQKSTEKPLEIAKSTPGNEIDFLNKNNDFPTAGILSLEQKIVNSCQKFGCNPNQLIRIMKCESNKNPKAINRRERDNPSGLFQYKPRTWSNFSRLAGFGTLDIWNEDHQILLTSWAFTNGYKNHWACK